MDWESDFVQVKLEPSEAATEEEVEEKKEKKYKKDKKVRKDKKKRSLSRGKKERGDPSEAAERRNREARPEKERKKRSETSLSPGLKLVLRSCSWQPPGYSPSQGESYPKPSAKSEARGSHQGVIPSRHHNPYLRPRTPERERSKGVRKRERWADIQEFDPSSYRKAWFEEEWRSRRRTG